MTGFIRQQETREREIEREREGDNGRESQRKIDRKIDEQVYSIGLGSPDQDNFCFTGNLLNFLIYVEELAVNILSNEILNLQFFFLHKSNPPKPLLVSILVNNLSSYLNFNF